MSIYPRTNYEMTEAQEKRLLESMQAVPMIMLHCGPGRSQQERANDAWAALGKELGFDGTTVQPRSGFGQRHFTAIPSETEEQRQDRAAKELLAAEEQEVEKLRAQIETAQKRLTKLRPALFP